MTQFATVIVSIPSIQTPGRYAVALKIDGREYAGISDRSHRMGTTVRVRPDGERFEVVEPAP